MPDWPGYFTHRYQSIVHFCFFVFTCEKGTKKSINAQYCSGWNPMNMLTGLPFLVMVAKAWFELLCTIVQCHNLMRLNNRTKPSLMLLGKAVLLSQNIKHIGALSSHHDEPSLCTCFNLWMLILLQHCIMHTHVSHTLWVNHKASLYSVLTAYQTLLADDLLKLNV